MTRSKQDLLVAAIFVGICIAFIGVSYGYGPRARLVPVPVAVIAALLVILDQFIQRVLKKKYVVNADEIFIKNKVAAACEPTAGTRERGGTESGALWLVVVLLAMVLVFGIAGGLFLYIFGFFKLVNKTGLIASLLWGVIVSAGIWVMFGLALDIRFYQGILEAVL